MTNLNKKDFTSKWDKGNFNTVEGSMDEYLDGSKVWAYCEAYAKQEKVYIFYRESFIQSIVSDISIFVMLLSALWINFIMLGNNWITTVFIIFMWFMWLSARSSSKYKRFTNKKDLQKFLETKDD